MKSEANGHFRQPALTVNLPACPAISHGGAKEERTDMPNSIAVHRSLRRGFVFAGLLVSSMGLVSLANAGECPAELRKVDAREAVNLPAKDVTDTVLAFIDVSKEPAKIPD